MPITIAGSGTITGISAGGLPDDSIVTADIANGAVTQAKRSEQLTLGTAQASTSGTSIDFTGIPSWVKRVTVMFQGVSTSGTSRLIIQIGAGSFDTSGYLGGSASLNFSTGFSIDDITAGAGVRHGSATLCSIGSNGWIWSSSTSRSDAAVSYAGGGSKTLSGTLDRIRITTVNGTDTFDAGSINIMYE